MMDWTDRRCRAFHRILTRRARLYTEMVTADAVVFGPRERLIGFDAAEHPVALQLGGAEPARLAEAARIGAEFGYDEIDLNCGCPSDRVQSGRFGACLMREPGLVAECVAAMVAAVDVPVTVKCRIGVDEQEPRAALFAFADKVKAAGAAALIVHARKAWLEGLSPKDNRSIPPLDYGLVHALKRAHPDWPIILNGGLSDLDAGLAHLEHPEPAALESTRGSLRRASSALVGEDRGGGSRRPRRQASDGAFDNLLGPCDPPPIGRSEERPSIGRAMSAPTRGDGCANAVDSSQMQQALDGIMLGRAAYQNPELLIAVDPELFGEPAPVADGFVAIEVFMGLIARGLQRGERLHDYTRHLHGLFAGRPGARAFRQVLATEAAKRGAGLEVLRKAVSLVSRDVVEFKQAAVA
jgi:tRNA-dihydrouridine synthase